jgi:hypothetical protein
MEEDKKGTFGLFKVNVPQIVVKQGVEMLLSKRPIKDINEAANLFS